MAEYEIAKGDTGVDIRLTGVAGREVALLDAFRDCKEGRCSCPSDEYEKVDRMDFAATTEGVSIRLEARAGAELDPDEISRCLDHTVQKVVSPNIGGDVQSLHGDGTAD